MRSGRPLWPSSVLVSALLLMVAASRPVAGAKAIQGGSPAAKPTGANARAALYSALRQTVLWEVKAAVGTVTFDSASEEIPGYQPGPKPALRLTGYVLYPDYRGQRVRAEYEVRMRWLGQGEKWHVERVEVGRHPACDLNEPHPATLAPLLQEYAGESRRLLQLRGEVDAVRTASASAGAALADARRRLIDTHRIEPGFDEKAEELGLGREATLEFKRGVLENRQRAEKDVQAARARIAQIAGDHGGLVLAESKQADLLLAWLRRTLSSRSPAAGVKGSRYLVREMERLSISIRQQRQQLETAESEVRRGAEVLETRWEQHRADEERDKRDYPSGDAPPSTLAIRVGTAEELRQEQADLDATRRDLEHTRRMLQQTETQFGYIRQLHRGERLASIGAAGRRPAPKTPTLSVGRDPSGWRVTTQAVGPFRLKMSPDAVLGQARQYGLDARTAPGGADDYEGAPDREITLRQGNKAITRLLFWSGRLASIEVRDPRIKTDRGAAVGLRLRDLERRHGPTKILEGEGVLYALIGAPGKALLFRLEAQAYHLGEQRAALLRADPRIVAVVIGIAADL